MPVAWVSSTHVGGWRSVARPGYGRGLDVAGAEAAAAERRAVDLDRVRAAGDADADAARSIVEKRAEVVAGRALERDPARR